MKFENASFYQFVFFFHLTHERFHVTKNVIK